MMLNKCKSLLNNSMEYLIINYNPLDRDAVEKRLSILQQHGYIYMTDENA